MPCVPRCSPWTAEAELAIGGADLPLPCSAAAALALADGALAQAETDGAFAVCIAPAAPAEAPVRGQGEWQLRLADALQAQRARLGEFEVRDAGGELLHLDCPMRLQLARRRPLRSGAALAGDGGALPAGGPGRSPGAGAGACRPSRRTAGRVP